MLGLQLVLVDLLLVSVPMLMASIDCHVSDTCEISREWKPASTLMKRPAGDEIPLIQGLVVIYLRVSQKEAADDATVRIAA